MNNCIPKETNFQSFLSYLGDNPTVTWLLVLGVMLFIFFGLFIIYKRGLTIGKKVTIPSQVERTSLIKMVEETRYYQKPDFIQKVADDYCWFYSHKGAMIKFGGSTWNHDDHYQALDLFQTLLMNEKVESIEFINSSIPSRVLTAIEKKLTKMQEENKNLSIYVNLEQKKYLENNLTLYNNKNIIEG